MVTKLDGRKLSLDGFLRLSQIIGNPNSDLQPLIPESKSSWWKGVRDGTRPPPLKLGPNTTVWRVADIRKFIADGAWDPSGGATDEG